MRRMTLLRAGCAALSALSVLALAPNAFADWPYNASLGGVTLSTHLVNQYAPCVTSDGAGGWIFAWEEGSPGSTDIYVQRLSAQGNRVWAAGGVAICSATGSQDQARIVSDGAGGAFVVWLDSRSGTRLLYAQRVNAAGTPQWTANGIALSATAGHQDSHVIQADGSGGFVAAWRDLRAGHSNIYGQRVSAAGSLRWGASGLAVCAADLEQSEPALLASNANSFYFAWSDTRTGTSVVDVYAQRTDSTGAAAWGANGAAVANADDQQSSPHLASDGVAGAYLVWNDRRTGGVGYEIYAQHLLPNFTQLLSPGGVALTNVTGDQLAPDVVADGSGGLIATWQDGRNGASDIYAARLDALGSQPWGPNGLPVCSAANPQIVPTLVADGSGGAVIVWADLRGLSFDVFAQRVTGSGTLLWPANGAAICTAPNEQVVPAVVANADGSSLVCWSDVRSQLGVIYAQRVDRWGNLGRPEPQITQVRDVAADQGGFARVVWNASYLDADPAYSVTEYRVYRSSPVSLALAAHRAVTDDAEVAAETGALLVLPGAATDIGWEFVGTQPADAFTSYSRVVATTSDSTAAGNKRTQFLVEARAGSSASAPRWYSFPDSGYSVDNLVPAMPAALTGQYSAGTTHLQWQSNTEADLDHYAVYRGGSTSFTPSPANLVASATSPGYVDAAGSAFVYKITAVDIHGNESPVATLIPSGTLGVDGAATTLEFAAPQPNPARGTTTLRFSLTQRGPVKLALYDAAGRRVSTIADGVMDAGAHSATLQLRDGAGRELSAGLYLARFEAEGRTITRRVVAVR